MPARRPSRDDINHPTGVFMILKYILKSFIRRKVRTILILPLMV